MDVQINSDSWHPLKNATFLESPANLSFCRIIRKGNLWATNPYGRWIPDGTRGQLAPVGGGRAMTRGLQGKALDKAASLRQALDSI